VLLGPGTVLDTETARAALLAGAEFIVAPSLNVEVIRLCRRYDRLVMPGAFTPTEVLTAWEAGADVVKVFPADVVGPAFFRALRGPLPQVKLMPTGGVDVSTAAEFLRAGRVCRGVGGWGVAAAEQPARQAGGQPGPRDWGERPVRELRPGRPLRPVLPGVRGRPAGQLDPVRPQGLGRRPRPPGDVRLARHLRPGEV